MSRSLLRYYAGPLAAGIALAVATLYTVTWASVPLVYSGSDGFTASLVSGLVCFPLFVSTGLVVGGVPWALLSLASGTLLAEIHLQWHRRLSAVRSIALGVGTALVLLASANWLLWQSVGQVPPINLALFFGGPFVSLRGYMFWVGLPSLMFVLGNGWYSYYLHRLTTFQ